MQTVYPTTLFVMMPLEHVSENPALDLARANAVVVWKGLTVIGARVPSGHVVTTILVVWSSREVRGLTIALRTVIAQ